MEISLFLGFLDRDPTVTLGNWTKPWLLPRKVEEREREREKEKMRPIYFCLTYLSFSLLDESEIFHSPRSNRSPSCLTNGFDVYCIGCPKINARFEFAAIFALSCWLKKEQFDSWTMYLKNKYLKTLFYI